LGWTKIDFNYIHVNVPWGRGLVVMSPLATEEIGAMGRGIESRQGIAWYVPNPHLLAFCVIEGKQNIEN
jgi:hypothetical protein